MGTLSFGWCQEGLSQTEIREAMITILEGSDSLFLTQGDTEIETDLKLLKRAEELSHYLTTDHDTLVLRVKKEIGWIYLDTHAYDSAIAYFEQVLQLAIPMGLRDEQIQALLCLGESHVGKFQYDKAIPYLDEVLTQLRIKEPGKYDDLLTSTYVSLGIVYSDMYMLDEAITMLKTALTLAVEDEDFESQLVIYNNLSTIYSDLKQYDRANELLKKAIKIIEQQDFEPLYYELYDNLGANYTDLKQFDSAQHYFEIGHQIAVESQNQNDIGGISSSIGWMYCQQRKFAKGVPYLLRSLEIGDSLQNIDLAHESSLLLASAYEGLSNYSKALIYYKKSIPFKEKLNAYIAESKSEEFSVRYKTLENEGKILALAKQKEVNETIIAQEKERQQLLWIAFLAATVLVGTGAWFWHKINKKRLLERQKGIRFKSVIAAEQKERKRIAQDLHDSLGQSISALKMLASSLELSSDEQQSHASLLEQIDLVYDELREVSHAIMPNTLITLGLVPALRELITELNAENSPDIKLANFIDHFELKENQTIGLYKIISEALSNIIMHARATSVSVTLKEEKGITTVYIQDNGTDRKASNMEATNAIGWKSILSRVALLRGRIDIRSDMTNGTSIAIHLG